MTDDPRRDPASGPPDPALDPARSPGVGAPPRDLAAVDVGRDVTLGEASTEALTAGDVAPLAGASEAALLDALREGSPMERQRAALALAGRAPSDAARRGLATAARSDEDPDVRQFAVEALGRLGGEPAPSIALAATTDPDPWVRAEAVVALDRLDRAGYAEVIAGALEDDHPAVRRNAAISGFKHRGAALLPTLLDLLDDPSDRVREWAAHLLGGVDDDRARATLERTAERDESPLVRATAARALATEPEALRRAFAADRPASPSAVEDRLNRRPGL